MLQGGNVAHSLEVKIQYCKHEKNIETEAVEMFRLKHGICPFTGLFEKDGSLNLSLVDKINQRLHDKAMKP